MALYLQLGQGPSRLDLSKPRATEKAAFSRQPSCLSLPMRTSHVAHPFSSTLEANGKGEGLGGTLYPLRNEGK